MIVVTLSVVCDEGDEDIIITEMEESHVASIGLYCLGVDMREATEEEVEEVKTQLPQYYPDDEDED